MKRSTYAIGLLLCAIAMAVLIPVCVSEGPASEQANPVACTYYGGSCITPSTFSGVSFRLFP